MDASGIGLCYYRGGCGTVAIQETGVIMKEGALIVVGEEDGMWERRITVSLRMGK